MDTIHEAEVVIHVDDAFTAEERVVTVNKLQARDGIAHARHTPGWDYLMVIGFDPSQLQSGDVL